MLRNRNTIRQVAGHWECSPKTIYRRIADGSLPCLRLGGIVRISREQVEAALSRERPLLR
jgi:excisionase family DNA binding protein